MNKLGDNCRSAIEPGWYQHFKGGLYFVLTTGKHTETEETSVVYLDEKNKTWVRPLSMFLSLAKDPETGQDVERFTRLTLDPTIDIVQVKPQDLGTAKAQVAREIVHYSFQNLSRWKLVHGSNGVPLKLYYADPLQKIAYSLNHNRGINSVHKIPFTLTYEVFQPKKARKMELWASFSNRIERK